MVRLRGKPTKSKYKDDDDKHSNHPSLCKLPLLLIFIQLIPRRLMKPYFVSDFGVQDGNDDHGNQVGGEENVQKHTADGPRLVTQNEKGVLARGTFIINVIDNGHDWH